MFSLWLYSPILGLGRLHKTFRFISFTRRVGRTPWTGDQLVARPLLPASGDREDGELGGMNCFGRGNRSTRRKPVPTSLYPLLARPGSEPGPPRWEAATKPNRLMLFRETVSIYYENHTEHTDTLCRQNAES
jgi:hypothetical protein